MKKILFLLIAAIGTLSANAQDANKMNPRRNYTRDSMLGRWVVDVNFLGGTFMQDLTTATSTSGYLNGVNLNTGKLKFDKGMTLGGDVQLGFFFGHKRHWGIGTGFMYLSQTGDLTNDQYHVEYQATDGQGNIYRQIVTGNDLKEKLTVTNMNIPLVLKYKNRFSKHWGFTGDIGALFNLQMTSKYKTSGSFDYEAVYTYSNPVGEGLSNGLPTVYDPNPVPSPNNAEIMTKAFYLDHHPGGDVNQYFADKRAKGYNVGLGQTPAKQTGDVSYTTGSVGFFVQPSFNYFFSDHVALNLGVYYMYQSFKNANVTSYRLIDAPTGTYSSALNNVTSSNVQSFGGNVGLRFLFGKPRDRDNDGIPDKRDRCPDVWGLAQFQGCPDTDKDGIQDSEDSCRTTPGLAKFHGCPDTDGDGIPDKDDECPYNAGPVSLKGCPDRDGDGIADKYDACPDKPGLPQFKGCPDTDNDGIPDNEDQCPDVPGTAEYHGCPPPPPPVETGVPMSTPILFELNKTVVKQESYPVLETAVKKMGEDATSIVVVHGHADATGPAPYNQKLSLRRAAAVKKQLVKMGADPKRIKVVGHGESDPAASNDTPEGRAENRRAIMRLNVD